MPGISGKTLADALHAAATAHVKAVAAAQAASAAVAAERAKAAAAAAPPRTVTNATKGKV